MTTLRTNKRGGFLFEIGLALALISLLIYGYIVLPQDYDQFDKKIGEKQYTLIKIYQNAERIMFYLDLSFFYASQQALFDQARNGGYDEANCGTYHNYPLWTTDSSGEVELCPLPSSDVESHFFARIQKLMDEYAKDHNAISNIRIPLSNYQFIIQDQKIIGLAAVPLQLPILTQAEIDHEEAVRSVETHQDLLPINLIDIEDKKLVPIDKTQVHCDGACYLTAEAAQRLIAANLIASLDPYNIELDVYSTYRSLERQKLIWDNYPENNPEIKNIEDVSVRRKYVCDPNWRTEPGIEPDPLKRCPHLTGGAVDLRIKGRGVNAQMSGNDWRILEEIMCKAGWVRYGNEEWHFEYGTDRWDRAQLLRQEGREVCSLV